MKFKIVVAFFATCPPRRPGSIAKLGLIFRLLGSIGPLILKALHCSGIVATAGSTAGKSAVVLERVTDICVVHVLMGTRCLATGRHGVALVG